MLLQEVMESFSRQEARSGGGSKLRKGRTRSDASRKVETQSKARMEEVSSGLNLPPGMKMPF